MSCYRSGHYESIALDDELIVLGSDSLLPRLTVFQRWLFSFICSVLYLSLSLPVHSFSLSFSLSSTCHYGHTYIHRVYWARSQWPPDRYERELGRRTEEPRAALHLGWCALSVGTCLLPHIPKSTIHLSQEGVIFSSGSKVCLESELSLARKEQGARGQGALRQGGQYIIEKRSYIQMCPV